MDIVSQIFLLLILFQVKHYFADYVWQNEYMLGKFKKEGWLLPLTCHVLVHSVMTLGIALVFNPSVAIKATVVDFVVHFVMDRIKASPNMLGRFQSLTKQDFEIHANKMKYLKKNTYQSGRRMQIEELTSFGKRKRENTLFWRSLGIDQKVHHLTHYFIIYLIVR